MLAWGADSATDRGMVLIRANLGSTAVCAIVCVWLAALLTRRKTAMSFGIGAIVALLPATVAVGMSMLAETEHLGYDRFYVMCHLPAVLHGLHTIPLFGVWLFTKDADTRRRRRWLALTACVGNVISSVVSSGVGRP